MSTIPVICDRCRATGSSGAGEFSHLGDLLDFKPVPVRPRANGWDPDAQRAFVALLSSTGSKRRAALAIGRNAFGMEQLLKRPDAGSLRTAIEQAKAIYKQNGAMKIAAGVADAAARNAQLTPPSRLRGHEPQPEPSMSDDQKWDMIEAIAAKFLRKVEAERAARTEGRIVAADFYLRQITFLEVMMELTIDRLGFDPHEVLSDIRRGEHGVLEIVGTPLAELLDRARCHFWETQGDPPRPEYPDQRFAEKRGDGPWGERGPKGYSTAVDAGGTGPLTHPAEGYSKEQWAELTPDEQRAARETQWRREAERQVAWEATARADWQARQGEAE